MSVFDLRRPEVADPVRPDRTLLDLVCFLRAVAEANCRPQILSAAGYALTAHKDALVPPAYYVGYKPAQAPQSPPLGIPTGILFPLSRYILYEAPPQTLQDIWHTMLDHFAWLYGVGLYDEHSKGVLGLAGSAEALYRTADGIGRSAFQCDEIVYRLVYAYELQPS